MQAREDCPFYTAQELKQQCYFTQIDTFGYCLGGRALVLHLQASNPKLTILELGDLGQVT
jgi:hypothetical protein